MTAQPTATVQNITALGVTHASATCVNCQHVGEIDLARVPPQSIFASLTRRLRCTQCNSKQVSLMPDWRGHRAQGKPGG